MMTTRSAFKPVLLCSVLVLLSACATTAAQKSDSSAPADTSASAPESAPASAAPEATEATASPQPAASQSAPAPSGAEGSGLSAPVVTLLDAGAAPHTQFRLKATAGSRRKLRMQMQMQMQMSMNGQPAPAIPLPAMIFVMDFEVKAVDADGNITYSSVVTESAPQIAEGVPPAMLEALKKGLGDMVGIRMDGTMTNRAFVVSTEVTVPENSGPEVHKLVDSMRDSLRNFAVPFPEEAMGVGARWEVKQRLKLKGMEVEQVSVHELVSFDGDAHVTKTEVTQHAEPQTMESPDLAAFGGVGEVASHEMKGGGTAHGKLSLPMPLKAESAVAGASLMRVTGGGQSIEIGTKMEMAATFVSE